MGGLFKIRGPGWLYAVLILYVHMVKVHAAVYDVLFNFNFMLLGCEEFCIAGVAVAVIAGVGGIVILIVIVIRCKKKKGQGINMLYYVCVCTCVCAYV